MCVSSSFAWLFRQKLKLYIANEYESKQLHCHSSFTQMLKCYIALGYRDYSSVGLVSQNHCFPEKIFCQRCKSLDRWKIFVYVFTKSDIF